MSDLLADDYHSYFRLDLVLEAQRPLSDYHDELIFIVGHQAAELWMKVVVDELGMAVRRLTADHVGSATRSLRRITEILDLLAAQFRVLTTITPTDYQHFRHHLARVSASDAIQPVAIDVLLGRRDGFGGRTADERVYLGRLAEQPSLYDASLGVLARRGLPVPGEAVERDWSEPYQSSEGVVQAWEAVYADPPEYWDLYDLAEQLVGVAHGVGRWGFEQRALGRRMAGEPELGGPVLPGDLFPELWTVRTRM